MVRVGEKERVRVAHIVQGMSIGGISGVMGHSRRTARTTFEDPSLPVRRRTKPLADPVIRPVSEIIDRWIE